MTKMVLIGGCPYPVVESLGFNHDIGERAWIVKTQDGEKTAVGPAPKARFWTPADRVRPLREYYERKAREAAQTTPSPRPCDGADGTEDKR